MIGIDFIGDIHGYADKLEELLKKLDYQPDGLGFKHEGRKALFVGDYIDRGPDNPRVVEIVQSMVESDNATALMGNHEYNAIMFNMLGKQGYLRPHKIKNFKQHSETLLQYHGRQKEYDEMIAWFKTLPLYVDGDGFHAMHASWDPQSIAHLHSVTSNGVLTDKQLIDSAKREADMHSAVEITCKGLEVKLPSGVSFKDKDGTERFDIRIKWWENPQGKTYKEMSVIEDIEMPSTLFDLPLEYYGSNEKPVFFGHYWLKGTPNLLKSNVCCLDYSVAKGGVLTAYRWNGEKILNSSNLVFV